MSDNVKTRRVFDLPTLNDAVLKSLPPIVDPEAEDYINNFFIYGNPMDFLPLIFTVPMAMQTQFFILTVTTHYMKTKDSSIFDSSESRQQLVQFLNESIVSLISYGNFQLLSMLNQVYAQFIIICWPDDMNIIRSLITLTKENHLLIQNFFNILRILSEEISNSTFKSSRTYEISMSFKEIFEEIFVFFVQILHNDPDENNIISGLKFLSSSVACINFKSFFSSSILHQLFQLTIKHYSLIFPLCSLTSAIIEVLDDQELPYIIPLFHFLIQALKNIPSESFVEMQNNFITSIFDCLSSFILRIPNFLNDSSNTHGEDLQYSLEWILTMVNTDEEIFSYSLEFWASFTTFYSNDYQEYDSNDIYYQFIHSFFPILVQHIPKPYQIENGHFYYETEDAQLFKYAQTTLTNCFLMFEDDVTSFLISLSKPRESSTIIQESNALTYCLTALIDFISDSILVFSFQFLSSKPIFLDNFLWLASIHTNFFLTIPNSTNLLNIILDSLVSQGIENLHPLALKAFQSLINNEDLTLDPNKINEITQSLSLFEKKLPTNIYYEFLSILCQTICQTKNEIAITNIIQYFQPKFSDFTSRIPGQDFFHFISVISSISRIGNQGSVLYFQLIPYFEKILFSFLPANSTESNVKIIHSYQDSIFNLMFSIFSNFEFSALINQLFDFVFNKVFPSYQANILQNKSPEIILLAACIIKKFPSQAWSHLSEIFRDIINPTIYILQEEPNIDQDIPINIGKFFESLFYSSESMIAITFELYQHVFSIIEYLFTLPNPSVIQSLLGTINQFWYNLAINHENEAMNNIALTYGPQIVKIILSIIIQSKLNSGIFDECIELLQKVFQLNIGERINSIFEMVFILFPNVDSSNLYKFVIGMNVYRSDHSYFRSYVRDFLITSKVITQYVNTYFDEEKKNHIGIHISTHMFG